MTDPRGTDRPPMPPAGGAIPPADPVAVLRSRAYLAALILAALIGLPVSAIAYGFLALVTWLQDYLFTDLPQDLFPGGTPPWWPVPWLVLCGLLTGLTIQYLPGNGGHSPALGFHAGGGAPTPRELVTVMLAAFTTLALGAVLGPEAPLIAIGGGLGVIAVRLAKRDAPPMATAVIASAGSFAAISTLLGSPLLGAFLIMEAAGIGGATLGLVVLPGLLAAGIGNVMFVGLGSWTGLGTFSLAVGDVPDAPAPTIGLLGWALVVGVGCALLSWVIRAIALPLRFVVHRGRVVVTTVLGLLVGLIAAGFQVLTGESGNEVLFSGQDALPGLVTRFGDETVAFLVVLVVAKGLAYALSLSAFRGGPVFPSMFIGAAIGLALAGLPGMAVTPAVAMGIGAMTASMLRLPVTATLLATLLLGSQGLTVMPEVIVAVVVAFVVTMRLPQPPGSPAGIAEGGAVPSGQAGAAAPRQGA